MSIRNGNSLEVNDFGANVPSKALPQDKIKKNSEAEHPELILMKPEQMAKCKLSTKKSKFLSVDEVVEPNQLSVNSKYVKCAIISSEVQQ